MVGVRTFRFMLLVLLAGFVLAGPASGALAAIEQDVFMVSFPYFEGVTFWTYGAPFARRGEDFCFRVATANEQDRNKLEVYVNGEKITPVGGLYTVENVQEDLHVNIAIDGRVSIPQTGAWNCAAFLLFLLGTLAFALYRRLAGRVFQKRQLDLHGRAYI